MVNQKLKLFDFRGGECFKETDSNVYPKGSNSYIFLCVCVKYLVF